MDPTIILQNHKKRVIPAKAGIQGSYTTPLRTYWIPAFAGMTLSLPSLSDILSHALSTIYRQIAFDLNLDLDDMT